MFFLMSFLSVVLSLLVAGQLSRLKAFDFLSTHTARFYSIDGLRGLLALFVFFHHYSITYTWNVIGRWVHPEVIYHDNFGRLGFSVFFMITGFLFYLKILDRGINWIRFFESRFFRIYPLYVFAVFIVSGLVFFRSGFELQTSPMGLGLEYLKWWLFHGSSINGYDDAPLVLAGVVWTLKYAWLFYLVLPAIALFIKCSARFVPVFLLFISVALFFWPLSVESFDSRYFLLFALGGIAAWLFKRGFLVWLVNSRVKSIACFLCLFLAIFYPYPFAFFHLLVMAASFILVVCGADIFAL